MKARKIAYGLFFSALMMGSLVGCGEEDKPIQDGVFSFTVALESNKTTLEVGDRDTIVIRTNGINDTGKNYTFSVNKTELATVGTPDGLKCPVEAVAEGTVIFTVKETSTNKKQNLPITIISSYAPANGGYNYASSSGAEAIATRTEILGKLEQYAVESHLTGITLFENGGYAKYSSRLDIPTEEYITGYGFGILSEGDITDDLPGATAEYKRYYHSAQSSNPGKINSMDDTGSQVSDLAGYVTSTYWGTKMNSTKNGYEWYPILAKDTVNGQPNTRPVPVYEGAANPLNLYKRWRIYVKTGADGLKYRTNGIFKDTYDNRPVAIEDYEFTIKMLLTGANQLARGSEVAADKTYGIKGAQSFFNRTSSSEVSQEFVDNTWNTMKANGELGFSFNKEQSYIEIELINEIDDFTAMYTLSSALYSPLPQEFVQMLGNGEVKNGAKVYGEAKESFNNKGTNVQLSPNDTTLSLGAYYLEKWSDEFIAFKQNESWVERTTYPDRYKIKGIKITTYKDSQEDPDALYRAFYADLLDSCGVPTQHLQSEKNGSQNTNAGKSTRTLVTKGDSTFKLNVNSCTQERWDYLFGTNGKICVTDDANKYICKPWMSNDNFLNGLYWSINRKVFAENRGVQPSIDYFSNAYLDDPEAGHSYNQTEAHKKAVAKMHNVDEAGNDDYGYNKDIAINYFTKAYSELRAAGKITDGTPADPTIIKISINWMYQNDINEYGNEIKQYFEEAFNDPKVCGGKVKLVVEQPNPSSDWQAVYNEVMMKGRFDLAFGAISGNTYNPLNFLEVLKSDNSSGFTLNWGADTSVIGNKNPLVYKGEKFSFDALWQVADHGGVVENGSIVNSIKNCYLSTPKNSSGTETNNLYEGFTVAIPMEFVDVADVALDVSKITLFVTNGETHDVTYIYDKANKVINVTIPAAVGASIDEEIKVAQKKTDPNKDGYVEHPFTRTYYGQYWNFELTYTLSIKGGTPVANTVAIAMTKDSQNYK
ncbi:MAG: hypothetical protein MJZ37_02285 [Bacilli bacterium]|nr:hypothetical protein [Bacilli bacterium]